MMQITSIKNASTIFKYGDEVYNGDDISFAYNIKVLGPYLQSIIAPQGPLRNMKNINGSKITIQ